jgi:LPXTG-site transpeptidase (sortase) family protein
VPRSRLRAWEAAAWIAALGVVATMVGFLVRSVPVSAPFDAGQNPSAAAVGPSPQCVIEGCRTVAATGPPTRVRIPSISVDSTLESLRLDARKELTAPVAYDQAGWYAGGVVPGDPGPAVIAGHVDSVRGPAVFFKLHTLKAGDTVDVERGGTWITFRVTLVEEYPKDQFPTDKVYRPTPSPELRVITCGGDFDTVHKRYYDNVVVYAVLA